jgi:hypothetical protein
MISRFFSFFALLMVCTCATCAWTQQASTLDVRLFAAKPVLDNAIASKPAGQAPSTEFSDQVKRPVILNFDQFPGPLWKQSSCYGFGSSQVFHGILTIDSPSDCYEFGLFDPNGKWNKYVSNARGWVVETSMQMDPTTPLVPCDDIHYGSVLIWVEDHTRLSIVGFATNEVCLAYPDQVHFPMDTTNSFHVYRIEGKGKRLRIYVDGALAIDHEITYLGLGTETLLFGDGDIQNTSLTRWDYFSYDVFPPERE